MARRALVLNHFAVPKGKAGHTRHVEIFDRLGDDWDYLLVAADRSLLSRDREHKTSGTYRVVWTTPYKGNGIDRIMNWVSYAFGALFVGIRQRPLDVVYASSPHLLTGLAGLMVARARRAGFVLEIRDLWPQILADMGRMESTSLVYRLVKRLELFLYRHADEIVVLAEGCGEAIRADSPDAKRITFLPNGSDPALFAVDESRETLRTRYQMEGMVFAYAGAHGPANGLNLVLDAAERIRQDLPDVNFLLVGDGLEKPKLRAEVAARGLTNVRFHDPIPKSEVPSLLRAADVGLHVLADVPLFRYGVSPNKVYDYMAAGLPVITNSPGEVERIVDLAGAGVAVEPDDLEQAVRAVAGAPEALIEEWGRSGQQFIGKYRSREVLAATLAEVLDRVAK